MDEHDDDLSSEVNEGEEIEIDAFPNTADELNAAAEDAREQAPKQKDEKDTDPVFSDVDPSEI